MKEETSVRNECVCMYLISESLGDQHIQPYRLALCGKVELQTIEFKYIF